VRDLHPTKRSVCSDRSHDERRPSGSGLTQQLAKNLFLSPTRNPLRKLSEAPLTIHLEETVPKRRLLEIYLNVVEFGVGIYGAEAAARHYFNKPASELS
jgi:monofunctional biosynthetic peptidoglycan transglycosylase